MFVLQLPPSYFSKLPKATSLMTSVEGENVFMVKMCLVSSVWSVEKMSMSERSKLYLHSYMSLYCLQLYILI